MYLFLLIDGRYPPSLVIDFKVRSKIYKDQVVARGSNGTVWPTLSMAAHEIGWVVASLQHYYNIL